ncbi:TPA: hypothetical protein L3915_003142 [Pseudomonas aeruginosa]|uniref:hypothetical protein n=1 Tax=Pseudomonas TaxID=286 RepID=UPI00072A8CAA|nr:MULTISPECIES: hypothetical protein [Pseudomonas]KRU55654.1 hypothetical protein AN449_28930 [Pseudomonas aeruginosa]MDK0990186.1 hypothetical protein [Pseudomonas aeruginosa]MDN3924946.1 hypothetical protein [Pseudomonas aeruginosa]MDY1291119.1 hypothetical protein [Pseudomonas aeruginosa]QNQ06774.1 hypothetical protein EBO27_12955 [Pseudomonas aeruginosa]
MDLELEKFRARILVVVGRMVMFLFFLVFLISAMKSIAISLDGNDLGVFVNVRNSILDLYHNTQYPVVSWVWEYSPVFYNYQVSSLFTFGWMVVFLGFSIGGVFLYMGKKTLREHDEAKNEARKSKLTEAYKNKLG